MKLHFNKMHSLGNDFAIIDNVELHYDLTQLPISLLSDRHRGIGFDQLLIIEKQGGGQFFCRIFNADGSEAEQCGNGLRCVARYLFDKGHITHTEFTLATKSGIALIKIMNDQIRVALNKPTLTALELPFIQQIEQHATLAILGNPHIIAHTQDINAINITQIAQRVNALKYFVTDVNVGCMQIINDQHIRLRTYERGVGETFACGSNACAAVAAGIKKKQLQQVVTVELKLGCLTIEWPGPTAAIFLTGDAHHIFEGRYQLSC